MPRQQKYDVIISEEARQMLVSHAAFLARVSPRAAEQLVTDFEDAARSLKFMPQRRPWLSGDYIPSRKYRFAVFGERYLLIFQIVDDVVYADYVVDCRQDYQWLIK